MRLIGGHDIWRLYPMVKAIEDARAAYAATSEGATVTPLRTKVEIDADRTLLTMPAYSPKLEAAAIKIIGLFPNNAATGKPTAPATVVLLDATTGEPLALLDGDVVTKIRTGASSGLAFALLANPDSRIGAVVGTGGQAPTQVAAQIAACPRLEQIRIANPIEGEAQRFVAALRDHPSFPADWEGTIEAFTDADTAIAGANVVTLVTSSTTPVISASALSRGVTVSCVGSYQPHMQECGSDTMRAADRIYCDVTEAALAESGDLIIPLRDGDIERSAILGDIGDVARGACEGRGHAEEIIVYETVGVGAQDLWAAHAIVEAACRAGAGTVWPDEAASV